MKVMDFCTDFSRNVAGIPIPKNAIFGKVGNYYYYFGDYASLHRNSNILDIYIMDKNNDWGFQKYIFKSTSPLCRILRNYIVRNKIPVTNKTVLVYPLSMGKAYKPDAKKAQKEFSFSPVNLGNNTVTDDNIVINCNNCKNYSMNFRHENAQKYRSTIGR